MKWILGTPPCGLRLDVLSALLVGAFLFCDAAEAERLARESVEETSKQTMEEPMRRPQKERPVSRLFEENCTAYCDIDFPWPGLPGPCLAQGSGGVWEISTCENEGLYDADVDGDGVSAPTDNCPEDFNPGQVDSDQDGAGDSCDPVLTSDAARIGTICSENYSRIDNCTNELAPPLPSIIRGVSTPDPRFENGTSFDSNNHLVVQAEVTDAGSLTSSTSWVDAGPQLPIDAFTSTFPDGSATPGNVASMPHLRSTNDGRLLLATTVSEPEIVIFDVNRVGYDSKVGSALPYGSGGYPYHKIPLQAVHDPRPGFTNLDYSGYEAWHWDRPSVVHATICDMSGTAALAGQALSDLHQRRLCFNASGSAGECHDIRVLFHLTVADRWELRSNAFTVFVVPGSTPVVYPLTPAGQPLMMPLYQNGNVAWHITRPTRDVNDPNTWSSPNTILTWLDVFEEACDGPSPEGWCDWTTTQSWSGTFHFDIDNDGVVDSQMTTGANGQQVYQSELWNGRVGSGQDTELTNGFPQRRLALFEPTTTADGMLLVVNTINGLYYSINALSGCDAAGFTTFKPLSWLPSDTTLVPGTGGKPVNRFYDIAKAAVTTQNGEKGFRDPNGHTIAPGDVLHGAYPWIDREGKNIIFARVNARRDGWRGLQTWPNRDWFRNNEPDQHPGKGYTVLGAWTQGKMVVLDNLLNATDWGGAATYKDPLRTDDVAIAFDNMKFWHTFNMALYQGGPLPVRPRGPQMINSPENQFNHLDAMTPNLPFDVVWNVWSNTDLNAEMVFDEYLLNDAFVVAHMNASQAIDSNGQAFPSDGFERTHTWGNPDSGVLRPNYTLQGNPILQNASTAHPEFGANRQGPSTLRLRGGARVEPVALGGVQGKGVYLDGLNDFVDMGFRNTQHDEWYYGIWLETHETDPSVLRTVFTWPDGSWVGVSHTEIVAYNAHHGTERRVLLYDPNDPLRDIDLGPNTYHHLGVRLLRGGQDTFLVFQIDGEPVHDGFVFWLSTSCGSGSCSGVQGFDMDLDYLGGWSWFAIGAVEPTVHGQSLLSYKGWVDEFRIYSIEERHKELNFVGGVLWPNHFDEFTCNLALGTLRKYSPGDIRCEQLNLTPHDTPLEMGPQRSEGNLVCADRVHRNADPVSGNGCVRPTALRFSSHRADQARSDFSSNAFCVGCHSHGAMVPGLDLQALQPGAVERQCDPRRQPMDWPAVLTGLDPVGNGASLPANHCSGGTGGMLVDGWLEGTQNLLGNGRVTPIL